MDTSHRRSGRECKIQASCMRADRKLENVALVGSFFNLCR